LQSAIENFNREEKIVLHAAADGTESKSMLQKAVDFFKKDAVLVIALLLAAVSMFFVKPDGVYSSYIDYQTLALLFSLMIIMAKFQRMGLFHFVGVKLLEMVNGSRQIYAALVLLCFFSSMLITNDVALITFVPFAITVLKMAGLEHSMIPVVILQTVAANLGSMLTPIGNPQNLYLYAQSGMGLGSFVMLMLPYAAISAVIFAIMIMGMKNHNVADDVLDNMDAPEFTVNREVVIYGILFLGCVLAVARIVPWQAMLILVAAVSLKMDFRLFKDIDYSLLLTFVGFFIFIGNMGRIPMFSDFLMNVMQGNEMIASVLASQVISNVPAALLLSGFTTKWSMLIIGTNLGGLGTLIASMASLISYKQVVKHYPAKKGAYVQHFTVTNVAILAVLLGAFWVLM
jgi:Na+/H+ antiporter NhaD/arsenite permease-like protein